MSFITQVAIRLILTVIMAFILTPLIRKLAFAINAVDYPNNRRINTEPMPTAGGLVIFVTFCFSSLIIFKDIIPFSYAMKIIVPTAIIVVTGLIDDISELSPKGKLFGIILASLYVYFIADISMTSITLPYFGLVPLGWLSFPVTLLWIAALTNAINLIDGLDGLASGVSIIALATIGIVGYVAATAGRVNIQVPLEIFVLLASTVGFFPFNFYPAKQFLGDTGALMLGFMIAIFSLQGLKNATFISLITPLIILGVPITDTVFAIIRRLLNKRPISSADKMHLHHRLLSLGFTHRGAVLMIYALAIIFSIISLLYIVTGTWATILLTIACLFGVELLIETIGLAGNGKQPLLDMFKFIGNRAYRNKKMNKKKNTD